MAELRARLAGCPLVRVSATPAVESAFRAGIVPDLAPPDPWQLLVLPRRHGPAAEPVIEIVDLRRHRPPKARFLAPPLVEAVGGALASGGQAMLFLNRRGYAPLSLCRACGTRLRCPNCSAWLVLHRLRRRLMCHHCGHSEPEPEHCPECGAVGEIAACGPGVERIAEEARALWPEARIAVVTSDTVTGAAKAEELVRAVLAREIDLLVGTQLLAKGHHFPDLLVVGVVDADLGLGGDLRAVERSFQLLHQVAGRAGRAERPGRALLQTAMPDHPVLQALVSGDPLRFYRAELAERRASGMPPFGRLAALVVSGRDRGEVGEWARRIVRAAPPEDSVRILGPAPAPMALLRGRYRERVLVRADPGFDLPDFLRRWLAPVRLPARIRLEVDVDPQSFL
ncbi:Primosomal protein N' [bacterium HR39]|nr:Primosomal protein N' [bacterium HR39]